MTGQVSELQIAFTPKFKQREFLEAVEDLGVHTIVMVISRQFGKSTIARFKAMQWLTEPGVTIGYLTKTYLLAREFYNSLIQMLPSSWVRSKDATRLIIRLTNGSSLLFFSAESVDNVRGFTLDYFIWDEVAFTRENTSDGQHLFYNILSPLLDAKGKKTVLVSTPNGSQGFFFQQYIKAKEGAPGYRLIEATVHDDETKTDQWRKLKKAEMTEKAWKQEYECAFLESGASYFSGFDQLFTLDKPNTDQCFAGIDFSSTGIDNTVVTFVTADGQTEQHIIDTI